MAIQSGSATRKSTSKIPEKPIIPASESSSTSRWTFLTNHAHVMVLLKSDSEMTLREVAVKIGITERAVQRIVHELEHDGYLKVIKVGRRNSYCINTNKSLRHSIESHRTIGQVLDVIGLV